MSKYEGMFLLDHGKVKNETDKGVEEVTTIISKYGGSVVEIKKWDERRLTFEINKQKRGVYLLAHLEIPMEAHNEITRDFNLSEVVSRHLITKIETEFPEFLTAQELEAKHGSREYRDRGRRSSSSRPDRESRSDDRRDGDAASGDAAAKAAPATEAPAAAAEPTPAPTGEAAGDTPAPVPAEES